MRSTPTRLPARQRLLLLLVVAMTVSLLPAKASFADEHEADEAAPSYDLTDACPPEVVPDSGFTDLIDPHGPGIDCLAWFELTRGITATEYGSALPITRAQTATFLFRFLQRVDGVSFPAPQPGVFPDVTAGATHTDAIEALAGFDPPILGGLPDGTFAPGDNITRQQFASIVARTHDVIAETTSLDPLPESGVERFEDVETANVHAGNIGRLDASGIMVGRTGSEFAPGMQLTRAQSATVLARFLGGLVDEGLVLPPALVSGTVSDATDALPGQVGVPVPDVPVTVTGDTTATATTDADGVYEVWLQQPGSYQLTVDADGFLALSRMLNLPDDPTVDFSLFRPAELPDEDEVIETTTSDSTQVTVTSSFWVIALVDDDGAPFSPQDAERIVLARPDGVVLALGAAGTDASYWSRNADGTSGRVGDQAGVHTLFYLLEDGWQRLDVEFDAAGTLVAVNGVPFTDPDAG